MRKKVFLISENTLKSETIINDNVGAEFIGPAIEAAQDIYLQQLIGTELIDKLYGLIADGTIKNEEYEKYKILLEDYITNYLKYKVLSEITIPLAYKYRNSGIAQISNDNTVSVTMRDAGMLQNHYELRATFYADRLSKYLIANCNEYPEYRSTRDCSDILANADAYQTNIVL